MITITIPKAKYDIMEKRASLYERILRFLPERKWGIEEYSAQRIKEFAREDTLTKTTRAKVKTLLASRK
ncbi:MAG: hypothetical protein G01um101433_907 [Parcubacteria group bacterium Gr01-1014_33]|nr:MAG: hypothetical protein G01um101433_907 [Parcubacteria group bacterium Gr01-1014_33]